MVERTFAWIGRYRRTSKDYEKRTDSTESMMMKWATVEGLGGLGEGLLEAMASHRVGDRPDRVEPRACQRRPQPDPG